MKRHRRNNCYSYSIALALAIALSHRVENIRNNYKTAHMCLWDLFNDVLCLHLRLAPFETFIKYVAQSSAFLPQIWHFF